MKGRKIASKMPLMMDRFFLWSTLLSLMALTVSSVNVRSMCSVQKQRAVFGGLKGVKSDVLFLQECGIPFMRNYKYLKDQWTAGNSYWSGSNVERAAGVGILMAGHDFEVISVIEAEPGRLLCVDADLHDCKLRLINVYAPTTCHGRKSLFARLRVLLVTDRHVVLGGDFNCIMRPVDSRRGILDESSRVLKGLLKDTSLVDTGLMLKRGRADYTWFNASGSSFARLDYLFTSRAVKPLTFVLTPVFFSDHKRLDLTVELPGVQPKGPGKWKLNCSLLDDVTVTSSFTNRYREWQSLKVCFSTLGEWWDMVKHRARGFFMAVGRRVAGEKKKRIVGLQRRLQNLVHLQDMGFPVQEDVQLVKDVLQEAYEAEEKKVVFQSRLRHLDENETCSRYFFKKLGKKKERMSAIKDAVGNVVTDQVRLRATVRDFYQALYEEQEVDVDVGDGFLHYLDKPLTDTQLQALEGGLTLDEVERSVFSFQLGKSPGSDGLPIEFFRVFWDLVKADMVEVFAECLRDKTLSESMRDGVISLLYKNKGERMDLKNWRPITLLNADYKVLAKVLMFRLQKVIGALVHPGQGCGVPTRSVTDNLLILRDVCFYAKERNFPLTIVSLDQEKAYDRVNHKYMWRVLRAMGMSDIFVGWLKVFYADMVSRVMVNGFASDPLAVRSGVRQGCPLSALLYVLCLEPFLRAVRSNQRIAGCFVPGGGQVVVKALAYMDDVSIVCSDTPSVLEAMKVANSYGKASGSKINADKSEAFCIGSWRDTSIIRNVVSVRVDQVKVLGIIFDRNVSGIKSWLEVVGKVKRKLDMWSSRQLTMSGKVLILKSIILPMLLFVANVFPPDRTTCKAVNRLMFVFFWGSKVERAARVVLMLPVEKGGKGVPDFLFTAMSMFVARIVKEIVSLSSPYGFFARFYFGRFMRRMGMLTHTNTVPFSWDCPMLYKKAYDFIVKFKLHDLPLDLWNAKAISCFVLDSVPVQLVSSFSAPISRKIWCNLSGKQLSNGQKDVAWMVVRECLPCRAFMFRRRLSMVNHCPRAGCTGVETPKHILVECDFAIQAWKRVSIFLAKFMDVTKMNEADVLYGPRHHSVGVKDRCAWQIISAVKEVLWILRCQHLWHKCDCSVDNFVRLLVSRIRDCILLEARNGGETKVFSKWDINSIDDIFL